METEDHQVLDQREWGQGGAGKTASSLPLQLPTKGSPSFYLSFVVWAVSSHTSFCLFLQITSTCFLDILYVSRQNESLSVAEQKYTASNLLLQKITSLPY